MRIDWEHYWREFENHTIIYHFLNIYHRVLSIRRNSQFPFYVQNQQIGINSVQDNLLEFINWLVDAHEQGNTFPS